MTSGQVESPVPSGHHWKKYLAEEQLEQFQVLSDSIRRKIGLELPYSTSGHERVVQFFERYLHRDRKHHGESDYSFVTVSIKTQPAQMTGPSARCKEQHQTTLFTPSLYNRSFVGHVVNTKEGSVNSAGMVFFLDEEVSLIKENLVPAVRKVHAYVQYEILGKETKRRLLDNGLVLSTVLEEAKQEIFSLLRAEGCRSAFWDGND